MRKFLALSIIVSMSLYGATYKRSIPKPPKEKEEINAKSKTGFMLGLENGYLLHSVSDADAMNMTIGVNIGYNIYFTDKVGLRFIGNYTYFIKSIDSIGHVTTHYAGTNYAGTNRFGFGLDFLYDYYNNKDLGLSLGVFAGLGFGYDLESYSAIDNAGQSFTFTRSGFYSYASLGFNIIFNSHNRIDISYRYTFLNATFRYGAVSGTINSPFALVIGYSYIF